MGPSRAERRREKWILRHILIISCLLVVGLWGFFGVLPSLGEVLTGHWCRVYWESTSEADQFRALEHLFEDSGLRAERVFNSAQYKNSDRIQRLAARWFEVHRKSPG